MSKFYIDAMLGKFGRTLRILGFDSLIAPPDLSDTEILNQCLDQNRYLVTNDHLFHDRMANKTNADGSEAKSLLMDSTAPQSDQLKAFFDFFDIDSSFIDVDNPKKFISRCAKCNGELMEISKDEIRDKINHGTYEKQEDFWICRDCSSIYWIGAHWENIKLTLQKIHKKSKKN